MRDAPPAALVWQATIAAALARRGDALGLAGLAIGLVGSYPALTGSPLSQHPIAIVAALGQLGLIGAGLVLAARTALDADLFRALAETADPEGFDRAMRELGLLPAGKTGRSMAERSAGVARLLRWQGLCVAGQLSLMAATILIGHPA